MTTRATRDVIDLSTRPVLSVDIDGGTIDGTSIGTTTPDVGFFTNIAVTTQADFTGANVIGLASFYADVAEYYRADDNDDLSPGTVVKIGGEYEIKETDTKGDEDVFGVVSTQPAYAINSQCPGNAFPVALVGRVPCRVVGPVSKGDRLVAMPGGTAMAKDISGGGCAFARSLVDCDREDERLVEAAIVTVK